METISLQMSSRALKRLAAQKDEELLESILSSSQKVGAKPQRKSTPKASNKNLNIFQLIGEDKDEDEVENKSQTSDNDQYGGTDKETSETAEKEHNPVDDETVATPNQRILLPTKSQKKKKKKNKKGVEQKSREIKNKKSAYTYTHADTDNGTDDEFDKILLEFQRKQLKLADVTNNDTEEYFTASEEEGGKDREKHSQTDTGPFNQFQYNPESIITDDLFFDTAFSKFPINHLRQTTNFFNTNFKDLDPHTEFKLLFDDIAPESLEDIDSLSSMAISTQQLKQIQRMKRLVRNWGGKDHRSVPNGPGNSVHRLRFTKVKNDWLPTVRGELEMHTLSKEEVVNWQMWQRPQDWRDVIEADTTKWLNTIKFYKFEPLNTDLNRKAMTDFYLSVILHPDHEALINLISSKFPYHVPALLQVALITIRQGDKSNTNGILQRALFVFDRALKMGISFDGISCQLPYIYFFNRQFYLAIFRYILSLAQRGAVGTASEWCKVLWSLSPLEDPLGCRYFMDHYLLLSNSYQYIIELSRDPLMNVYKQWYTLGFGIGVVLSYLKIGEHELAKKELLRCFRHHPLGLATLFSEKLAGDPSLISGLDINGNPVELIEMKAYMARFSSLWKSMEDINFLHSELAEILSNFQAGKIVVSNVNNSPESNDLANNPFFSEGIPVNLLRFVILSEESSVMASIPAHLWAKHDIYEFDVLPPVPTSHESEQVVENVKSFINERDLAAAQAALLEDTDLLDRIRQLSLQQYIQENETMNNEEEN